MAYDTFIKDPFTPPGGYGSESAPFNVGKVRMSARIFENKPIRSRNRQVHEFFFNHITLKNIKSTTMNDLEITYGSDSENSSRGVTFKKLDYMYNTFLARRTFKKDIEDDTTIDHADPGDETQETGSYDEDYIGRDDVGKTPGVPEESDMEFYYKYYKRFTLDETEALHSCFYQNGSIYSETDMNNLAKQIRKGMNPDISEENWNKFSDFISFLEPEILMHGFAPVTQERKKKVASNEDEVETSRETCYIYMNCAYPGNFYKKIKDLGLLEMYQWGTTYIKGETVSSIQKAYKGIPPGKHSSFKKLTPIFPGEDFSIDFRRGSQDESVCTTQPSIEGSVGYRLINRLRFLDPYYIVNGWNPYSPQVIPPNFGVAKFVLDADSNELKMSNTVSDFSSEPYVIVEIDGGLDNLYFLVIAFGEPVRLYEVHDDPEIVDFYDKSGGAGSQTDRFVCKSSTGGHSSLIYEFDFNGSTLLKEDRFKVSFQHVSGSLSISFNNMSSSHLISRDRISKEFTTRSEDLLTYQQYDGGTYSQIRPSWQAQPTSLEEFDAIAWQPTPIKLRGYVHIHMGHYSSSFNFSPIKYVDSSSIEQSIGIPVLGFFLKGGAGSTGEDVTSLLFRSRGAPHDANEDNINNGRSSSPAGDFGIMIGGEEDLYFRQQATLFKEIVNGKVFAFKSENLPYTQREVITGLFDHIPGSINEFDYGKLKGNSSLTAKKTRTVPAGAEGGKYSFTYNATIQLSSGSVSLEHPYDRNKKIEEEGHSNWLLESSIRPICYGFTSFVSESKDPIYEHETKEVGQHVMSFSDNWSRNDRSAISHDGTIKFYLSRGRTPGQLRSVSSSAPPGSNCFPSSFADDSPSSNLNMNDCSFGIGTSGALGPDDAPDETSFLTSLQDKTFYIRVYAWREGSYFYGTTDNQPPNESSKNHLIFTGICDQSSFDVYDSHVEMTCTLSDYSKILEDTLWFNSPYYDAMRDVNVVYDIMQQAGFFEGSYEGDFDPASLIKKYASLPTASEYSIVGHNGECLLYNDYVLPGHYDPLQNPLYKFDTNTNFYDAIKRIAAAAGNTSYFDRFGVFHYDVPEDEEELFTFNNADSERVFDRPPIRASFWWSSDPRKANEMLSGGNAQCPDNSAFKIWNVITSEYNFKRLQSETFNEIRVISTTPDMKLLLGAHMNVKGLHDPTSQGFRGYKKVFLQQSGYFGARGAVEKQISRYTMLFTPPSYSSFSVLGRAGLRPMNTITLEGVGMSSSMRLVLVNVSNEIDASKNEWITSMEGRYFYPGQIISFKGQTVPLQAS